MQRCVMESLVSQASGISEWFCGRTADTSDNTNSRTRGHAFKLFKARCSGVRPPPISSDRHHRSNGDCLEGKRKIFRSVLCRVVKLPVIYVGGKLPVSYR